jgi:hypothetical protein
MRGTYEPLRREHKAPEGGRGGQKRLILSITAIIEVNVKRYRSRLSSIKLSIEIMR